MLRLVYRQPDPSHTQDATELAVCEEGDVASQRPQTGNQPVSAFGYLRWRFAARASVPKNVPIRPLGPDLGRAPSLVVAIVPLDRIRFDFSGIIQSGKRTRSSCAQ